MARFRGTSAADTLKGSKNSDDIYGASGNDLLYGYNGNDEIEGGAGHDRLYGGAGQDELEGGTGNDKLYGGSGNDDLEGGAGNDRLDGGAGNDELEGGAGKDVFVYGAGRDEIEDFNFRDDTISLDKSLGIDSFAELMSKAKIVDDGEDILFNFGNGNTLRLEDVDVKTLKAEHFGFKPSTEEVALPTTKNDKLYGTTGNDTLDGGAGNDKLYGRAGNDVLKGGSGHDELEGGNGNDKLYGGSGNDDLEGGAGNDRLNGGSGRNELEGGSGADTFIFTTGITEIEDFRAGTDRVEIAASLGVSSFDELKKLAKSADGGDDVRIDFGSAVLTFEDTKVSQLRESDFFFV